MGRHAWVIGLASLACAPDTSFTGITPDIDLPDPLIEVSPTEHQFGELGSAESARQAFTIKNVGDGVLDVDRIVWATEDPSFELFLPGGILPAELELDETLTFEVAFQPASSGLLQAAVRIDSDGANEPSLEVPLGGLGATPELTVEPERIDYGNRYVNCAAVDVVTIDNVGKEPITVTDIAFVATPPEAPDTDAHTDLDTDAHTDAPVGAIVDSVRFGVPPRLPADLDPGDDMRLSVAFEPLDATSGWQTYVVVESTAPDSPHVIPVTGSSRFGPTNTDTFVADTSFDVDIIFAVDQSCSMTDQAVLLGQEITTFTDRLEDLNVDWKVGVLTGSRPACFEGVFEPTTPGWQAGFQTAATTTLNPGFTNGGFDLDEGNLEQIALAIDNDAPGACNEGFRRGNAPLQMVIVTDEADQSTGWMGSGQYWQQYLRDFEAYAGATELVTVHGVLDENIACGLTPAGTNGYRQVINATGGSMLDVCGTWADDLPGLIDATALGLGSVTLSRADLIPSSITVRIEGILQTSGWTYEAATNRVLFDTPPTGGSTVEVMYELQVDCLEN